MGSNHKESNVWGEGMRMTNAQIAIQSAFQGRWQMDSLDKDGRFLLAERMLDWLNLKDKEAIEGIRRTNEIKHPSSINPPPESR